MADFLGGPTGETINGTVGADNIQGGGGADSLFGADGDDIIYGHGPHPSLGADDNANDQLDGGNGNDTLYGEGGNDTLHGGYGFNIIYGGAGNDIIWSTGIDTIDGGTGTDNFNFNYQALATAITVDLTNVWSGGTGSINGSAVTGIETLTLSFNYGSDLNDSITIGAGLATTAYVAGRNGDDTITGGSGNDQMQGDEGNDTVIGLAGNDILSGGNGIDQLNGGDGLDQLTGDAGDDTLNGGLGNDTLAGSAGIDTINGDDGDDSIQAGADNDIVNGGAGNDTLYGDGGNNNISGGDGNDIIYVTSLDTVEGGTGTDYINFNYQSFGSAVTIDLTNVWSGGAGMIDGNAVTGIETLLLSFNYGSNFNDSITIGAGHAATAYVAGRNGDDTITGGSGNDQMQGDDGNDLLSGLTGNDIMSGGNGIDQLNGGDGLDQLTGDAGDDALNGGLGNDTLAGSAGIDTLNGEDGDDSIQAGADNDIVNGGAGNDTLYGDGGNNTINGGDGNDIVYLTSLDTVDGGIGTDYLNFNYQSFGSAITVDLTNLWSGGTGTINGNAVTGIETLLLSFNYGSDLDDSITIGTGHATTAYIAGRNGNDSITGGSGNDQMQGDDGSDILSGLTGNDIMSGGNGNDTIFGDLGTDSNDGGAGIDTINYAASNAAITINLTTGAVSGGHGSGDTSTNFENLIATGFDDTIIGSSADNLILAGAGNDSVTGGLGADYLIGQDGNDVLYGGAGSANILQGGLGDDIYIIDTLGDSTLEYAGEGVDEVQISVSVHTLQAHVENLRSMFAGSFLGIGNGLDNVITGGNAQRDDLYGQDGNDRLIDGGGADGFEDTMIGGIGDDIFVVGVRGSSTIELAGEGTDTVITAFSIYGLQANVENLTAADDATHAALVGNELGNVITGGTGGDDLYGRAGNDRLVGGGGTANTMLGQEGDDIYVVGAAGDTILEFAGEGIDTVETALASLVLTSNVENLTYTGNATFTGIGSADNNVLTGGAGADFLSGLDGNDTVIGGGGGDTLLGGNGADQFRYVGGDGVDTIVGFTSGTDKIALLTSAFVETGSLQLVQGAGAAANSANSTFLYDSVTGILSYDDDGNGAGTAIQLASIGAGLSLGIGDFMFV